MPLITTQSSNLPSAALLLVFLRTVPLFSTAEDEGPFPTPTCRPDLLVVDSGGGGGVVELGKLFVMLDVVSFNITLTEFFFEFRMATLLISFKLTS